MNKTVELRQILCVHLRVSLIFLQSVKGSINNRNFVVLCKKENK